MVGSLKSSLVLAFVACQMVCVIVEIGPHESLSLFKRNLSYHHTLEFEIIHGGFPFFRTELPARSRSVGFQCLKEKEKFYIKFITDRRNFLMPHFFLAFDSEKYDKYERYNHDVKGIVGQEFCITWGTYSPTRDHFGNPITFYFNIYTNKADLLSRYFYFFEITNLIKEYSVRLDLGWIQPDETKPQKEVIKIINLGSKACPNSNHNEIKKEKTFSFRENRSYVISENRVFEIAQLIDKTQPLEDEVSRALEKLKEHPASEISSLNPTSWTDGIKCGSEEEFKYEIGELTLQKNESQILI